MKTVSQILRAAKALIANPDTWCQGAFARDSSGKKVAPDSPMARRWCGEGAIDSALRSSRTCLGRLELPRVPAKLLLYEAANFLGYNSTPRLNDQGDHATVMRAYDLAIKMAEEREAVA